MEKSVKITFTEQSKHVVATTQVEYSGEGVPSNDVILTEGQELFDKATLYSARKTMQKR